MEESRIYFKYDGETDAIKNHQIDVRLLASTLDHFADLITEADSILNERESAVQVKAQAGFVQGSFGVELIVAAADPTLLEALGLITAPIGGGLISLLRRMKGKKVQSVEVEEGSELAKVLVHGEEPIEVSPAVARLAIEPEIRRSVDRIISQPLHDDGIDSFSLFSDLDEMHEEDAEPLITVSKEEASFFKKPKVVQNSSKSEDETVATIQFVQANKDSGSSGWRIVHISDEVSVKIEDAEFLLKIQRTDTPSIFSSKYKVDLTVVTTTRDGSVVRKTHKITKVHGPIQK